MESLPVEMVELIVRQLTPQDLTRCSAVCREWREIFNQDWMWEPHCDPELEEPLRTIPCVATPAFVAPEAENSTLSPISSWKLAFMREKHLWKNWSSKDMMVKSEEVIKFDFKGIVDVDFLTDTLVVVWYSNHIDILDVSVVPSALVAKTDFSVRGHNYRCRRRVIGPTMLLLVTKYSIHVFNADVFYKTIKLKHTISVIGNLRNNFIVQEQFFICLKNGGSKLAIVDLNIGKLLKEEPCPGKKTQNEKFRFLKIKRSPTSDFVACQVLWKDRMIDFKKCYKYYIYSLEQLAFLPGPVAEYENPHSDFAIQGHWLAAADSKTLKVYNLQTRDVLLSHEHSHGFLSFLYLQLEASNNCFVFIELHHSKLSHCLQIYLPSNQILTTLSEMPIDPTFRIINDKFITIFNSESQTSELVWKLSGQAVEKCDMCVTRDCKINRSFTKVLNKYHLKGKLTFDINFVW